MGNSKNIIISGAAVNQTPFDWVGNKTNIIQAIKDASKAGSKFICLPELSICGYGCEDMFLSDWLPKKCLKVLFELITYTEQITVILGLPLKYNNTLYNVACVISDKKIIGFTPKQFLANDGVHYEPRWFSPWPQGLESTITINDTIYPIGELTYQVNDLSFAIEICEDAWREDVRPLHRYKNIDIVFNPSASHYAFHKSAFRENLVSKSSSKFQVPYFYINLLGNEAGRMIYDGEILLAINGEVKEKNKLLSYQPINQVYFNLEKKASTPALSLSHDKFNEFTQACSLGLYDYLRKAKAKGFVLSLSGGADSSACAVLVSEMIKRGIKEIGFDNFVEKLNLTTHPKSEKELRKAILTCVYQGTKNSSEETLKSAKNLAKEIKSTFHHWTIDHEVASYTSKIENALERKLDWSSDDIALQNIQARTRSPIIWMLANIKGALLITTSNRSEGDVGYATMDGDTSGSIAPIAGVDKQFILEWLKWAEKTLGYNSLAFTNSLTPSAELRPVENTQTDEKDLMPYPLLKEIEYLAIYKKKSPIQVYDNLLQDQNSVDEKLITAIMKFFSLWSRNQWKRERIAPSFHLDEFNVDPRTWCRFPILNSGFEEELKQLKKLIN